MVVHLWPAVPTQANTHAFNAKFIFKINWMSFRSLTESLFGEENPEDDFSLIPPEVEIDVDFVFVDDEPLPSLDEPTCSREEGLYRLLTNMLGPSYLEFNGYSIPVSSGHPQGGPTSPPFYNLQ